jgi:hypothetical protein
MMEVDALSFRIGMTAVGRQILKNPRLEKCTLDVDVSNAPPYH